MQVQFSADRSLWQLAGWANDRSWHAAEASAPLRELQRKIGQFRGVTRAFPQDKRLHQAGALVPASRRLYVRFIFRHNSL
jgi:hypothetical protein